jgi:hypothetical protein
VDIFDEIEAEAGDPFEELEQDDKTELQNLHKKLAEKLERKREREAASANRKIKTELTALIKEESNSSNQKLIGELTSLVKSEVSKLKPVTQVNVVERIIHTPVKSEPVSPVVLPPKVIEKTIIQQVERKDKGEIESLKKELESLKKQMKERDKDIAVQYIGTMIPNYSGQDGTVLTARNGKIQWETGNSSGSGMPTNWTWEDDGTALVLKYNGSEAGRWPYPI